MSRSVNSERGKTTLTEDCAGYCPFLWSTFSPTWHFDDETFARTAASFDNPDFVEVVLHSYRHRIGAVPGDPALEPVVSQFEIRKVFRPAGHGV